MTQSFNAALGKFGLSTRHTLEDFVAVEREIEPYLKRLDFADADKATKISASFFAIDVGLALVRNEPYSYLRAMKSNDRLSFGDPNLSRSEAMAQMGTNVVLIINEMTTGRDNVWKNKIGTVLIDNHLPLLEANLQAPVLDALLALWCHGPLGPVPTQELLPPPYGGLDQSNLLKGFVNDLQAILDDEDAGSYEVKKRVKDVVRRMREQIAKPS